ncbi:MAG: hypothetical protein HKN85_08060 [Gammaproteobacteria bacterium]|nr:hypothetical protein [Gammaproteobacteria bacterium]
MSEASTSRSWDGFLLAARIFWKKQLGRFKMRRRDSRQAIHAFEYRVFSQHREDGIIDYLLDLVGVKNATFVEFGFWADECNCLNLVLNRNFSGLFMDGSAENCNRAKDAYAWLGKSSVSVVNSFLTAENINLLITANGISGEIDVLSVDVDGNDYWLWSAIDVVNPRIVVVEYNATFGPEKSITVPYDPGFVRYDKHPSGFYHGASLMALTRLGSQKGYSLVGCDYTGVNAFFVRKDLLTPNLDVLTVAQAYMENRGRVKYKGISTTDQFKAVEDQSFVEIQ